MASEPTGDRSARVLIIDDEEVCRRVHAEILKTFGHQVIEARSGEEGLERFAESPDLVLLDLRMPGGVGGLEVLRIFHDSSPDVPVVVVSGSNDMEDAISALRFGAWDFLLKPTSLAVFKHTVDRCLERARLIRQNKEFKRNLEMRLKAMREEEEAGRKIQARLLPPTSETIGDCHVSYRLMPSMYLSGDFVDFFELDDNRFAFCLADVSGHGVSSALVTVFFKSFTVKYRDSLKHHDDETICRPADLAAELNVQLLREQLDKHMTLFFGVVDFSRKQLSYVNAGHFPPPIFFTESGVTILCNKGMPVGLFDFATFECHVIDLPPRFRLTLFSDGILEVLGDIPLKKKQEKLAELAENDRVGALLERAGESEERPDDIAVLTIERGMR